MPPRTQTYIKYPWDGGINTSVDPGMLNDNDLVIADNVVFASSGSRLKRESLEYIDSAVPAPDARSSSGTTRTLYFYTNNLQVASPSQNDKLVDNERITVTTTASSGNETNYAATARIASITARAEVTEVTCVADVSSSLNNKYFYISQGDAGSDFYVWFNVDSAGTDPAISGRTGIEVAISENDTASTIASAIETAVDAESEFSASASTDTVTITAADAGYCTDASDAGSTGFTISVTTQGGHLITYTASGTLSESETATTTATVARATQVLNVMDYWRTDSNNQKAQLLLAATDYFQLFKYDDAGRRVRIEGEKQVATVVCAAASTLASSGAGDYFTIYTANDETFYAVWFDVDSGNSAPTVSGATLVEVDVAGGDTDAQVATKLQTAIDALAGFSASVDTATVTITNADEGRSTDAADQNTGFTITVTTDGAAVPETQLGKVTSIVALNRAIFAFNTVGDKPIKYRPESSAKYQVLGGDPPDFSIMCEYQGRLWTNDKTDPERLHYSSPGNVEEWNGAGDSGALDIAKGDGDSEGITGIFVYKGILFVQKQNAIFRVDGTAPENYQVNKVSRGVGGESQQAVVPVDQDDVMYVSKRGFHSLAATDQFGDVAGSFLSAKIQPTFNEWSQARLKYIQGAYVPELNSVAYAVSEEGQSSNNAVWFFNVQTHAWYRWPNVSCTALTTRRVSGRNKLLFGTNAGRIVQAQTGEFTDFDTDGISYRVKTGTIYPGGNPTTIKAFKRIGFFYRPKGDFEFTVRVKIDNQAVQALTFEQEAGGDQLEVFLILSQSVLGSSNILAPFTKQIDGIGRGLTIEITQTGTNEQVEIYGYIIEFEEAGANQEVIQATAES